MIELNFSGESYADILTGCKNWLAQQNALGTEPAAPVYTPQPESFPNYLPVQPEGNVLPFPTPVAAPVPAPMPAPIPTAPAAVQAPMPTAAPAYPPAPVPPAPIPTAAPEYTQENLMHAGAQLMQSVGLPAMQQLLARFGVPAIHQLPRERYGEFAQALRDMGGTI